MENQNKDAAANVVANVQEERMHPIFEECEVMVAGKPAREHMLSMNGMYISGITDEQLKEMHEKLTELLTGEKPMKYFYAEVIIPSKDGHYDVRHDMVTSSTDEGTFPLTKTIQGARDRHLEDESLDLNRIHVSSVFEINKADYNMFIATRVLANKKE
ncbi:hypothetical protein [Segatella copri]|jgi:hypothetical protein|uniref:Uncharacterized protein n=1 Tax=Segatella copri TaxID=165179 RepID=A0AAW4N446_9BACT|nr:hypothetical protein [Segatella copri]MBV3386234.1 hypothetical protein [Segatella copri]MBV3394266.1 hypothetical protein [Segatella copri]MBV3404020.1 hypothetical protein [Segatella copri]